MSLLIAQQPARALNPLSKHYRGHPIMEHQGCRDKAMGLQQQVQ